MELSPLNKVLPTWDAPTLQGGFDLTNVVDGQRLRSSSRQFVQFYNKKFTEVYAAEVEINPVTGATKVKKTATRDKVREMVRIITPGDKNEVDDFVEDYHRREHWKQYTAFRDGRGAPLGKDLDQCAYVSSPIATELKYLGCHTEEQLADSSDVLCNQIPNGWEMREFARSMVKADKDNQSLNQVNQLRTELTKAQDMIRELQQQMKGPSALSAGEAASLVVEEGAVEAIKRSPGRPRRLETATEG